MCTVYSDLDDRLSSPWICQTGLMLEPKKTGDSLSINFMKLSHIFHYLSYTRLSQFTSNTEIFMPRGFQGCLQVSTSRSGRNGYGLLKWTGGRLLWWGSPSLCNVWINTPELQWGLHTNMYLVVASHIWMNLFITRRFLLKNLHSCMFWNSVAA
jgi:hypothetical protein